MLPKATLFFLSNLFLTHNFYEMSLDRNKDLNEYILLKTAWGKQYLQVFAIRFNYTL